MFARLSAVYGHIWQSQFKSEGFLALAKKEWEETLREFEDYSINLAINTCRKRHEMPPTLPMLYQLCRSFQPLRVSQYRVPDDGLPTNPAVLEKYNQIIAEKLAKKSEKEI
ncbi:MAG: hypothetical protein A3F13_03485 [Gammaproteobacteria bacterium RIFCSPHIGHO2_12_FULL_40_19]|nr:MAG: hypothetical protein A3F13_03485 [Gammaproteobacteria bacterium RIFCSPHIGHO2_12_FULL_40_19]